MTTALDPAAIRAFIEAAEHVAEMHTLAISHRGSLAAEVAWAPYSLEQPQLVYSVSKTLTAMAVGALLHSNPPHPIDLTDPILHHLPPPDLDADPVWQRVTIEHCLAMATGHTADAWRPEWGTGLELPAGLLDLVLASPPDAEPGSVFAYNQAATYLLSRMVTHVTGAPLRRVAHERVLGPLGLAEPGWFTDPAGFDQGWSGAHVRTGDLLTLGEFWLRDGCTIAGERLLPEGFLARATRPFTHLPTTWTRGEWTRGYGYSFWLLADGFRADGAFGQFAVAVPSAELVVAITSISTAMHDLGELIAAHLLPGIRPGTASALRSERELALLPVDDVGPAAPPAYLPLVAPPGGSRTPAAPGQEQLDVPVSGFDLVGLPAPGSNEPLRLWYAGTELSVVVPARSWGETTLVTPNGPYAGLPLRLLAQGGWHAGTYRAQLRIPSFPHHILVTGDAESACAVWPIAPLHSRDPFAASPARAGLST